MPRWQVCLLSLLLGGAPLFATTFTLPIPTRPTSFPLPLPHSVDEGSTVVAWGWNGYGQTAVPAGLVGVVQVAAGETHTVALKSDGTVVAWGWNADGQTAVPAGLVGVVQVAAGAAHTVALKSDGTVVAWGWNADGQTAVPAGLVGVVQVAAGYTHTVALKSDGTVVAWGANWAGQTAVPAGLVDVVQVAAGGSHTVALKSDGTVVTWGDIFFAQTAAPAGLVNVVQVAAGYDHTVALKSDGTVVAWGWNEGGQTAVPAGLVGVVQVSAGFHSVALKSDGTVVAWGWNDSGQTAVPAGLVGVVQVAAGHAHTVAVAFKTIWVTRAATKRPFEPATAANWSAGGTAWSVDTSVTHDGVDSAKAQTTDGQSTYREYTVTGPSVVDFWWKASSEQIYDTFSYSLNGVNQETISGEVDWTHRTLTLPAGTHTIRWTYTKDESGAVGQDAGWLDDFAVYPTTATLQVRDRSTVLDGEVTVDFASADQSSAGLTKTLTFANTGSVPLEAQLSLPEGSPFTFQGGVTVHDVLLGRGETRDIPITLSASARGTKTARLTIVAPDSTVVPPQVTLLAEATLQVRDGSTVLDGEVTVDFASADQSIAGLTKSLTFANKGHIPLEAQLSLPEGSPFTFEGGVTVHDVLLGRGETRDIPITLSASARGTKTARLTIVAPDSTIAPPQVTLLAEATLQVRDGSTVLSGTATVGFGSADLGSAGFTKTLTFANTGFVPLGVQLSLPQGSPFTFNGGAATYGLLIGRSESVDVPITLATTAAGNKSAQLTISAPESTTVPPFITLTGYVSGPDIGLAQGATTLASGQTFDMGLAPQTVEFTIRNNGNVGDLVISAISATGNFQITQQPATTIPPQGSTTFKVLAQSISSGTQTGSISITSNAAHLAEFSLPLFSKSLTGIAQGITDGSVATSGTGGAIGWDFATTQLPSGQNGQALKTGATPNNGASALEFTAQTAGVVSWTWKVSTQENFDWLLCEVDGQEAAGISTKNGVWQTQVVQVSAGANVRWVYRKDALANIGEDAGYLADVEFRSLAANQSFSQWAQTHGSSDPQQRMPKSALQAMFAWLGGIDPAVGSDASHHVPIMEGGRLKYRFPISKTADGTQQILFSADMSSWTPRRFSQRVVSEDADRIVIEATAPSGTKGFFKVVGGGDTSGIMVSVQGGTLPRSSELSGTVVATFRIGKTEVTWDEWQKVRDWAAANGYSDLAGVGAGSAGDHPVREVSWYDAVKWCNAKSENEGLAPVYQLDGTIYRAGESIPTITSGANGYRLPREAEWEWAARGGLSSQGYVYSGSNDLNSVAWYLGNTQSQPADTKAVGTKAANELGINDMSGNVWEWSEDVVSTLYRRVRGGSWNSEEYSCVVGGRGDGTYPNNRSIILGFRVARNAD